MSTSVTGQVHTGGILVFKVTATVNTIDGSQPMVTMVDDAGGRRFGGFQRVLPLTLSGLSSDGVSCMVTLNTTNGVITLTYVPVAEARAFIRDVGVMLAGRSTPPGFDGDTVADRASAWIAYANDDMPRSASPALKPKSLLRRIFRS